MFKGILTAILGVLCALGLTLPAQGWAVTTTTASPATTTLPSAPTPMGSSDPAAGSMASSGAASGLPGAPPSGGPLSQQAPTPHVVQDAITGLQKTDPINMDDMIRAQDAINRLDLLLEIEKRQTELKKVREERNKPVLTAGIPASALGLPTMRAASAGMPPTSPAAVPARSLLPPEPKPDSSSYTLRRIVGASGKYLAVLSTGGDRVVSVRAGETLPDGSKVRAVTLTSVSLVKDRKSKTLTIPSDAYIVRGSQDLME